LEDWKYSPTLWVASDLVSVALTLGLDRVAVDAAQFVYSHKDTPSAARSIAALCLRNAGVELKTEESNVEDQELALTSSKVLAPLDRHFIISIHQIRVVTYAN
jgi:hypothetical protein